jgi:hypothetical protein
LYQKASRRYLIFKGKYLLTAKKHYDIIKAIENKGKESGKLLIKG